MQKILHTKASSFSGYSLILTLYGLMVTKGHTYYLNKSAALSMYDLLLASVFKVLIKG